MFWFQDTVLGKINSLVCFTLLGGITIRHIPVTSQYIPSIEKEVERISLMDIENPGTCREGNQ